MKDVILPGSDPLVLTVGGTTLTREPGHRARTSAEPAWNTPPVLGAKDEEFQRLRGRHQRSILPACLPGWRTRHRRHAGCTWTSPGTLHRTRTSHTRARRAAPTAHSDSGVSAATPFWAGLIALADQEAGHPLGFVNPAIYRIARGPAYHTAFHDITIGNNMATYNGHHRRLPGRTRLGPGHGLGYPQRPGPHPSSRPLTQLASVLYGHTERRPRFAF